jgi:hypothetical protein
MGEAEIQSYTPGGGITMGKPIKDYNLVMGHTSLVSKASDFFISLILFLVGMGILCLAAYLTYEYWSFFSDPGWTYHGKYKTRIEGGNLWYLLGMYTLLGASAIAILRIVYQRSRFLRILLLILLSLASLLLGLLGSYKGGSLHLPSLYFNRSYTNLWWSSIHCTMAFGTIYNFNDVHSDSHRYDILVFLGHS